MEMFAKVQHQKKWEICLPFSFQRHKKEILRWKYECFKACIYQLHFYKTWVFVFGTSDYVLDKHSYY